MNDFKGGAAETSGRNIPETGPKNTAPEGATNTAPGSGNNKNKITVGAFNFIPVLFNTIVKVLPIGLYAASLMESLLFNDVRGFFIFLGLLINDSINTAYNYIYGKEENDMCALVRNMHSKEEFYTLPTPHTEYISFITAILMTSMFFKKVFNYGVFVIFAILVGLKMYNRVMVGCKDFIDAGYSLLMGIFKGIVYYIIVKDFYEPDDTTPEDHWLERALKKFIPRSDGDDFR